MSITTISSREFNQDIGRAKRAAAEGPVFITDRGNPAHVLLSISQYQEIIDGLGSIIDSIAMEDSDLIEFDAPKLGSSLFKPADLL